jgi:succinoglycan biosynthesis transport protein ExoP
VDLRDYARILRARWRSITALTLVGLAAALAVSLTATPTYQSGTQLFVTTAGSGDTSTQYTGNLLIQSRVKSYADIITSPLVTQPVVEQLNLPLTAGQLSGKISASAPLDKVLLNVTVTDTDPQQAIRIANAVSEQFTKVVADLETTENSLIKNPVKLTVTQPAVGAAQVTPRTKLNVALGLLVGLALGLGFAVLREQLDTRVKGARGLQDEFGVNTLGVISFDPETPKKPLTVQISPQSPRAESFRQLRTNLQFVDIDHPPHSLVITSSLPSDGKSTTTCNLAIALAESGRQVLLIEADLRRPKLGEYLGLTGVVGLSDVLIGRVPLQDALQDWGTTGRMKVLLSGAAPPNPAELLGSQQMADLLKHCEEDAFVVIDAPPLLPVTDAAVLSRIASGTVLVVRAGRTREDEVRQALANLEAVGARVYGAVINMAPTKGPDARRYGYGYGYGYGYAGQNQPTADNSMPTLPTPLASSQRQPVASVPAPAPASAPLAAPLAAPMNAPASAPTPPATADVATPPVHVDISDAVGPEVGSSSAAPSPEQERIEPVGTDAERRTSWS